MRWKGEDCCWAFFCMGYVCDILASYSVFFCQTMHDFHIFTVVVFYSFCHFFHRCEFSTTVVLQCKTDCLIASVFALGAGHVLGPSCFLHFLYFLHFLHFLQNLLVLHVVCFLSHTVLCTLLVTRSTVVSIPRLLPYYSPTPSLGRDWHVSRVRPKVIFSYSRV